MYVCTASNEAAAVSAETELLIENVPPRAPYDLVARPGVDSVHLSWMPGERRLPPAASSPPSGSDAPARSQVTRGSRWTITCGTGSAASPSGAP